MLRLSILAVFLTSQLVARAVIPLTGDVYVFDDYVLDTERGLERLIPTKEIVVQSCENSKFFCLKSSNERYGVMNVVIPKKCVHPEVGDTWTLGEISTKVESYGSGDLFGSGHDVYVLANNINKSVRFAYTPVSGIIAISVTSTNKDLRWKKLITFAHLASCSRGSLIDRK